MRRPLIIAEPRDPLARALARRMPNALYCRPVPTPVASFCLNSDGSVRDGTIVVDGQAHDWRTLSGLLFRPGRAWAMPPRFASVAEGLAFHERRTAWCALLAAFPGTVLDRMPPAWFLDPALYGASLACGLAGQLGCAPAIEAGDRQSGRSTIAHESAPRRAAFMLADEVIAADAQDAASRSLARWLRARSALLANWQRKAGVHLARIDAQRRRGGWAIESVDPVPSLARVEQATLDARCTCLAALLR